MDSGTASFHILKQYILKEINAGNLKKKYDVIIFVSGAIPSLTSSERSNSQGIQQD